MSSRDLKDGWSKAYREHPAAWDLACAMYRARSLAFGGPVLLALQSQDVRDELLEIAGDWIKAQEHPAKKFSRLEQVKARLAVNSKGGM